jgi:long-chain acyl-CoA synthetase
LVAILVPEAEWLQGWAQAAGKATGGHDGGGLLTALADDPDLRAALDAVVARANREVSQLEKVRRFVIAPHAFTVDNDMMTPTLKVRRHKVKEAFGDRLEALYGR